MNKVSCDIWDYRGSFIVIPVNLEGVMGRGLSRQVADRWPQLAASLRAEGKRGSTSVAYNDSRTIMLPFYCPELGENVNSIIARKDVDRWYDQEPFLEKRGPFYRLVMFPVKRSWKDQADLHMIKKSLGMLANLLRYVKNPHTCAIPQVGCGYGELTPEQVIPIIEETLEPLGDRCVLVQPDPSLKSKYPEAFKPGYRSDKTIIEAN